VVVVVLNILVLAVAGLVVIELLLALLVAEQSQNQL
jgi:hypothetical protein